MDGVATYADDTCAWSREQAALLRRLAESRPDLPNALDLANIAEEIESVGNSELRRVESFLRLMLEHLLKIASIPEAPPARHWHGEIRIQHETLLAEYRPSMRQLVDLDRVWRAATARADAALDTHGDAVLPDLPENCPFSLDELVAPDFDRDQAVTRLRSGMGLPRLR